MRRKIITAKVSVCGNGWRKLQCDTHPRKKPVVKLE
jgi:hypothetical protein